MNLRPITAQAPDDFDDTPVEIIFAPNTDTSIAVIPIMDNDDVDEDRILEVLLDVADAIGTVDSQRNRALATITNDDGNDNNRDVIAIGNGGIRINANALDYLIFPIGTRSTWVGFFKSLGTNRLSIKTKQFNFEYMYD